MNRNPALTWGGLTCKFRVDLEGGKKIMTKNNFYRRAMGLAVAGAFGSTAWAQQSIDAAHYLGISYEQDFDNTGGSGNGGYGNTLNSTGSGQTALPTGWQLSEDGANTTGNYNTTSAGSNDLYSYGSTSAERALGSWRGSSNAGNNIIGVTFKNDTTVNITRLYIQFTGEQWWGGNSAADKLSFSYNLNAASIVAGTGTWVTLTSLDFNSPSTSNAGAIDGNANKTTVGVAISSINIPAGQSFSIRWRDFDSAGTIGEDGLAIDDLIVMVPEPWQPSAVVGAGLVGLLAWQRRRSKQTAH